MSRPASALVRLTGLRKSYPVTGGVLRRHLGDVAAVDEVDLTIRQGETVGLVGESGCGKSTLGRLILRLEEPDAGQIIYDGTDVLALGKEGLRQLRQKMQIIFQDPFASLNPRHTVGRSIGEGLTIHRIGTPAERDERVRHLMQVVGLRPEQADRYPHEFSGGQRQRIGVARALALQVEFIICDEPVSALDVSIQAQILNLLLDLQQELGLTYLFVSHDLHVVRHISDRVAVMYLGRLVELAPQADLYRDPLHPYTQTLLEAAPVAAPGRRRMRRNVIGDVPSPLKPPRGCHFHPRCPRAMERCRSEVPNSREQGPGHWVRCFLYE